MGNNNNKKSAIILTIANNERFKEKFKKYSLLFDKIREEKNKSFQISCKKFKNDENYEFNDKLIERHFFLKALQEVNELLAKNSEGFLFELSSQFYQILEQQLSYYFHSRNFYDDNGDFKASDFIPDNVLMFMAMSL